MKSKDEKENKIIIYHIKTCQNINKRRQFYKYK